MGKKEGGEGVEESVRLFACLRSRGRVCSPRHITVSASAPRETDGERVTHTERERYTDKPWKKTRGPTFKIGAASRLCQRCLKRHAPPRAAGYIRQAARGTWAAGVWRTARAAVRRKKKNQAHKEKNYRVVVAITRVLTTRRVLRKQRTRQVRSHHRANSRLG